MEGGLCSPSHFRPKHVCLRVPSNSSGLGIGYPFNSVMGKDEKHKTTQEGGGKKSRKCLQQKQGARSSARESSSMEKAQREEVVSLSFPRCCGLDVVRAHLDYIISVLFILLLAKLS